MGKALGEGDSLAKVEAVVYQPELVTPSRDGQAKRLWRWLFAQSPRVLVNLALIILLTVVVVVGGLHHRELNAASHSEEPLSSLASPAISDVDEAATVYIAANVATHLELPVAEEVNQRVATVSQAAGTATTEDGELSSEPQTINTPGETSRQLQTYLVQEGDKLAEIAKQFNISTQTIIWANDISSAGDIVPNMELRILPVDGVLHRVSDEDSLGGIAGAYKVKADEIINFNDLELDGLKAGQLLIIPGGVKPELQPTGTVATSPATFAQSFSPSFNGNGYDFGWCTWHAANRRAQIGSPVPSNWGNAYQWRYNAAASGYRVGYSPQAGAVAWHRDIGGLGHVAFVERVTEKGAWLSDMNYPIWGSVTHRFVSASEFGNYNFIY